MTTNEPHLYPAAQNWRRLVQININYLGITAISQSLTPLIIPLMIQQFVGETRQATYFGNLRLWTLMVAVLVQSLAGLLSDRSTHRWGKRRPFILVGTLLANFVLVGIGINTGMEGLTGYWVLFILMILLMVAINVAQSAQQGFIPDLVPEKIRGKASGLKALFEIPIPLIFVAFTIAPLIGNGQIWGALSVLIGIVTMCLVATMLIREQQPNDERSALDWRPFFRLVVMTIIFSSIILVVGGMINFLSSLLSGKITSTVSLLLLGITGLVGMVIASGLGVFASTMIGLGWRVANQNRRFSWWIINRLMFLVGAVNLASFAVYYLQVRLGFEQESASGPASILLLFVGIAILLVVLPAGYLSDRFGHLKMTQISGITATAGVICIIITTNLAIIYVGAVLIGMATGLFYTSNWALGTQIIPNNEAGKYLGIANLAGAGAGAVGAYIGGPIADYFTLNFPNLPETGYILLFLLFGCMFVLSIFVSRFLI